MNEMENIVCYVRCTMPAINQRFEFVKAYEPGHQNVIHWLHMQLVPVVVVVFYRFPSLFNLFFFRSLYEIKQEANTKIRQPPYTNCAITAYRPQTTFKCVSSLNHFGN